MTGDIPIIYKTAARAFVDLVVERIRREFIAALAAESIAATAS